MRLRGRRYDTGQLVEVTCDSGSVIAVGIPTNQPVDHEAEWIAPGFFDLQVNGAGGVSFNSGKLTGEDLNRAVRLIVSHGVTQLLPTLVSNSHDATCYALATIRRAVEQDKYLCERIAGVHLEGPWISSADGFRGAHPQEHIRLPSLDEFLRLQEAAGGRVRMVTLAPELPGAISLIEYLVNCDVLVSIGHSLADYWQIKDAKAAGARMITHLGNGVPAMLPRHANPIWDQLAHSGLNASIIADGFHLTDPVMRCIYQINGSDRLILISDASSLAGMPPGRYREWDQDVEVIDDGRVLLSGTPYLAGSGVFLDHCVGYFAYFDTLQAAIQMASHNPRSLLKLPQPDFREGSAAELVLFDKPGSRKLTIRSVVC